MTTRRTTPKKISAQALVRLLDGPEKPIPVYRFGTKVVKYERPRHNPFGGL